MNRSPQYDVSSYAENASETPDYPGTYPMHQHGTIPSHRTQKWRARQKKPNSTHSSLLCTTHEEYNRENMNDKL
jgi:hypothetical protein